MMKHEDKNEIRREHELELAGPFLVILAMLAIIGFLIPLRPENSVRERRKLTEFPAFSFASLLNGDWFDGITAWYSDTYPGRETMLEVSDRIDALHGLNRNEITLTGTTAPNDNAELDALLEEAEANAANPGNQTEESQPEAPALTPALTTPASPEPSAVPAELPEEPETGTQAENPADPDAVVESWTGLDGEEEMAIYGDMVVIDGTVLSRMGFDKMASDHYAELLNRGGDALAEKGIRFFSVPVPTSISVLLSSDMLAELGAADQSKTIRYIFAQTDEHVGAVNAFNNLLKHNTEYLYFNTDHHWTALGAYYTYEAFCEEAGFDPVPLSEYEEWNMGEFIGTYYYSVNNRNLKPDEMIAYVPPGNSRIRMEIPAYPEYNTVIVDESGASPNMKYNCFLAGDNAITTITNDAIPDAPDCIVIKDSYGNPFSVYLTQHYHHVYVLDYRKNFLSISSTAEQYGVQDVILLQSIGVSQTNNAQGILEYLLR